MNKNLLYNVRICRRISRELAVSLAEFGPIVVSFIELFYAAPVVTILLLVQFFHVLTLLYTTWGYFSLYNVLVISL